jgi:hypothetical protein
MVTSADCTTARQHRFGPLPPASHDEYLARRHAERAPRASPPEAKLTSSFDQPADCVSDHQDGNDLVPTLNDASSRDASSSVPISAPPSASHDEYLARRHTERAPRVNSPEAKLTSSFDQPADCVSDHQVDATCELASHLRFTHQRTGSARRDALSSSGSASTLRRRQVYSTSEVIK